LHAYYKTTLWKKKSIISVPFSEKQIDIIVSNHSITLRISLQRYCIVSRMPQRSSHTLDEAINPSRLLNQLSDVDHVDLRGCEVCGFQDTLWTRRITLTEDSCVNSYLSKSSKVVLCF